MAEKIRAIVKRPDEKYGHVTNISNTLKNFQKTVDGPIEVVYITKGIALICNEEGKLLGLEENMKIRWRKALLPEIIVGTAVIVGVDGEDFCDCPLELSDWKELLKKWGN